MAAKVTFVNENDKAESFKANLFGPDKNRVKVANVLAVFKSSMATMGDGSIMEADDDDLSMDTFVAGGTYNLSLVRHLQSPIPGLFVLFDMALEPVRTSALMGVVRFNQANNGTHEQESALRSSLNGFQLKIYLGEREVKMSEIPSWIRWFKMFKTYAARQYRVKVSKLKGVPDLKATLRGHVWSEYELEYIPRGAPRWPPVDE